MKKVEQYSSSRINLPSYRKKEVQNIYHASKKELGNTIKERRINFKNIIKAYYPFFSSYEFETAYDCIYDHEKKLELKKKSNFLNTKYGPHLIRLFGKIDEDQNNTIDLYEFKKIFEKIFKCDVSSHFENADKDGNGVLDLEEFLEFVVREPNVYKYLEETVNTAQLMIEETRKNYLSSIFDTVPVDDSGNPRRPSLCDIKVRKI